MAQQHHPRFLLLIRIVLPILLFLSCSLGSLFLYVKYYHYGGIWMPGMLYTCVTILVLRMHRVPMQLSNTAIYFLFMVGLYIGVWFITLMTAFFAFLTGILTAGLGATLSFHLTNRHMLKIQYDSVNIFLWGALTFLLTDIFNWALKITPVQAIFANKPHQELACTEIIVCWQLIVGLVWLRTVSRKTHSTNRR